MLRPEQMSKVSVTGAKSIMDDVIETMHDLNLVHITDYDDSWEGFDPGSSLEGADEVSSKLVTVRAIENILDLDGDDVSPSTSISLNNADERLEEIRTEVNELDNRRDELRNKLRDIDEQLGQMELFADLGVDLDLLWGYDSLDVLVGEGDSDQIAEALAESDDVEAYEVFSGEDSVAAFARLADEETSISDVLVGVPFTAVEVPEATGDPESNVEDLRRERQQVEAELDKVQNELEALKHDKGAFLLALEEKLTIDAQKSEAPLRFATTQRSFIVEGWVPSEHYDELVVTLEEEVGDRIEIAELEQATYTGHGSHGGHGDEDESEEVATDGGRKLVTDGGRDEPVDTDNELVTDGGRDEPVDTNSEPTITERSADEPAEDGTGEAVVTDGGSVTVDDDPPVVQKNSEIVNPFEVLVKAVNRPKYNELDPTITIFLTFPLFFGFMIGDIGYGLLYVLIGYVVYDRFDAEAVSNFGAVVVWLGLFTIIFGVFYGEIFGLHLLGWLWGPLGFGSDLFPKGLTTEAWAIAWLIMAVIAGWIQLNLGYLFQFIEEWQNHGAKPAIIEGGSWLLMLNGIWVWIFSHHASANKPAFLVGPEATLNGNPLPFAFTGFPELVGILGIIAFLAGIVLLLSGPWFEVFEFLVPVVHVLSYTRLTAVLLSKAGMAVAANLLYFGAYRDADGFHFIHTSTPGAKEAAGENVIFGGLSNMGTEVSIGALQLGIEGALLGIPVLIIGHLVVLAIGGTAALQAIRLEYVEFFGKFYEGGGKKYEPFGYERRYTTDD